MSRADIHQQLHGYRKGHQLLSGSLDLDNRDQDVVDRLSDLTGRLRPGELFDPYLSAYPLPSEAYYVLARTFQDLKAPRSGCVLTRSLFVPMNAWVELTNLDSLLAMLLAVHEGEEARVRKNPPDGGPRPEKVRDGRMVDLVQALFLEDERPIVVFEAAEAGLIATRLLVALWPGLRRHFSVCTLALGPRRLGERDFDLVFAPTTARSRFSGDAYRRIDVLGSVASETVHRSATPTAARIFCSDQPSLAGRDVLGFLAEEELGDRAAVRMVLRWNELASRAEKTPTAVLGMLDILNSRGGLGEEGWDRLLPAVGGALEMATVGLSARASWEFLLALSAKVGWGVAPAGAAVKLEVAARSLARREPKEALRALEGLDSGMYGWAPVVKGVGDGVVESAVFEALSEHLGRLGPNMLLSLVDLSDCFGERLVKAMNATPDRWIGTVVRALKGDDAHACRRVRRRLVLLVDEAIVAETLPHMLAEISGQELAILAVELGRRGTLGLESVSAALAKAARNTHSVDVVRDEVVRQSRGGEADAFLLKLVALTKRDVVWLLDVDDGGLVGRLLTALLAEAGATTIRSTLSSGRLTARVVSVLRKALPASASEVARILRLGLMRSGPRLDVGFEVVSMVPQEERREIEKWLLRELFSAARPGDARVARAIAEFGGVMTAEELVSAATVSSISPQRVSENLVVLGAAEKARDRVVGVVDVLSRCLVERRREELGEDAYRAWGAMLADAGAVDPERRIIAAGTVLGFASRHVSYPVSALVVAAFPTVYRELAKLKDLVGPRRGLPGLPSYFRLRWKKPKDGRRELIDALVNMFLRSSWPPADLMVAALEADAGERVVKHIRRRLPGARYLESIGRDAGRLDEELSRRVLACITDAG